jgi:hypothetical protein
LAIGIAVFLLLQPSVKAQLSVGSLTGQVSDASGAVIAGAEIVVTNEATGIEYRTQTSSSGYYTVLKMVPGTYTLTASMKGMSTFAEKGITLLVDQTVTVNVTLQVGTLRQEVVVTGGAALLNTSSVDLGTVTQQHQIVELPLNGRQMTQLLQLSPGIVPVDVSQNAYTLPGLGAGNAVPSVNGQGNRSNLFYVDGMYASNPFFSGFSISPSIDAIQEFKVESHDSQAEFGQANGGIVNVVTKSGSNGYHGDAYEFLRNSDLDARNSFIPTRGVYRQNQFGGTFGGPIRKDKAFFFGYYEGYRQAVAASEFFRVPTSAELGGDFTKGGEQPIFDPATTVPDPANPGQYIRSPFVGNQISTSRFDPNIIAYLKLFVPPPNYSGGVSGVNYLDVASNTVTQNNVGGRVDYQLSSKDQVYGRYSYLNTATLEPFEGGVSTVPFHVGFQANNVVGNWNHIFSPTLILHVLGGYGHTDIPQTYSYPAGAAALLTSTGFINTFPPATGVPIALFPGFSVENYWGIYGGWGPIGPQNIWDFSGDVTKIIGRHELKFGATYYHLSVFTNWVGPSEGFTTYATAQPEQPGTTGNALASFLLGLPDNASRPLGDDSVDMRNYMWDVYGQDSFKITPKLTLNIGVRYDYGDPVKDIHNRWAAFDYGPGPDAGSYVLAKGDINAPSPLPADVVMLNRDTIPQAIKDNIALRLGLAYNLSHNVVIRAGAGEFFDNWATLIQGTQGARGNWPSGAAQSPGNLNRNVINATAEDVFASLGNAIPATPFPGSGSAFDPWLSDPLSFQWNLEVEKALGGNIVASVGYVGSQTERQIITQDVNFATTLGPSPVSSRVQYPQMYPGEGYDSSTGRSSYESLQAKLEKRFSHGSTFLASYTWSHLIDLGCSQGWEGCNIQDPYNMDAQKGNSVLDVPQIFTLSYIVESPFGKGKPYLSQGGAAAKVLEGWQVGGITALRHGLAYTIDLGTDNANNGGTDQRPNLVGTPKLSNPTPTRWFNTSAYAMPAPYTYGNLGRNTGFGDGLVNFDFSLVRKFQITERHQIEFRSEFFNLFNTPNYGHPTGTLTSSTFGEVTSAGPPRIIQFALKYLF